VFLTQYCAGGKIEMNEMSGACGAYGEESNVYRVLGEPEGKKASGQTQT
jgi:hypothetical protein